MMAVKQLNLLCFSCYKYEDINGGFCMSGFEPKSKKGEGICEHWKEKHVCRGGLVRSHKVTKDECRKCAMACGGCLEMAVAYGFIEREKVAHLL